MSYYILGGVKINSTQIPYRSVSLAPELEKVLLNSDARSGHSYTGIKTASPMVTIVSEALAAILNITGLGGATFTAFEVFLIKHGATGVASGNVHRKWTMTAGVIRVDSIATSNGHAEITIEVHGTEDGTNAVWVMTDNVALPTSPRATEVWYQGPLYVGTTLYQVEQSTFAPNGEMLKRHSNGAVGPVFAGIKPAKPTLGIQAADGVLHGLAGSFGDNVGPVTLFYRHGAEGDGLRVANATETHIKITIPSAFLTPEGVEGTPGQEVGFGVMFDARDDGTNAVASLDTTAAIAAPE